MRLLILALIIAIIAIMAYKKDMWNNLPWGKEPYQEPSLIERSVR